MNHWLAGALFAIALSLAAACGGGDSTSSTGPSATSNGVPTLSGLQGQLASVLLQQSDVGDGLSGSAPSFSTNEDLAGPDTNLLNTLAQQGRQLGVDVQFLPTDRLDPNSPLKGGIQSSASVYTKATGASQSFQDTKAQAKAADWRANYPSMRGLAVTQVAQAIGDESYWFRISGIQPCTSLETGTPAPNGAVPTVSCNQEALVVLDNVLFRAGRARAFLQISEIFPVGSSVDSIQDEIRQWAQTVAQRAATTFPVS